MWAFFSRRLRMWLVLAVAAPVVGWLAGRVADVVEARRGPNGFTRTLRQAGGWLNRHAKGPLRARNAPTDRAAAAPAGTRDAGVPAR